MICVPLLLQVTKWIPFIFIPCHFTIINMSGYIFTWSLFLHHTFFCIYSFFFFFLAYYFFVFIFLLLILLEKDVSYFIGEKFVTRSWQTDTVFIINIEKLHLAASTTNFDPIVCVVQILLFALGRTSQLILFLKNWCS